VILVYGVTSARARVAAPLRLVTDGGVAAIVREVRRGPAAGEAALRAYDRQVTALASRLPALLPARFATTFADLEELRLVLRARQRSLRRALRAVRGRAQMTIRFANARPPGAAPNSQAEGMSGAAYLRARAAARAVPGFEPLRAAVRRWVRDERVENHGRVASVYHLVPRASVDAYRAALVRAADAAGDRVLVTGPYPPYAFATSL
jgi:hypothetical protein